MRAVESDKDGERRPKKKPGRVPTSCAECRRLKLRCDRKVPCEKCVSRGCGSICPDGALTPGKNNKMILANTEELHDRIDHLTSRVRELESALQSLQAQVSDQPHPLLQKDFLQGLPPLSVSSRPRISPPIGPAPSPTPAATVPSSTAPTFPPMDPDPASITDSCGTLSISENGQSCFFGSTARLEFLAHRTAKPETKPSRLSRDLIDFACQQHREGEFGEEVFKLRPQLSEAIRLCELYLRNGKVMYSPIHRSELIDEILMTVYRKESFSDLAQPETLALLFMVFAISSHFDPKKPVNNCDSIEHYYLARACLRLSSHRENTLLYLQTLIHMAQYLHFSGAELTSSETLSECLSRAIRIGYKMGLHLHGIRWNLSDDLAQKRSRIFCEIFLLDTWTSFYSGRPPMISLAFMDRTTPKDYDEGVGADGNKRPGFHTWTYKYAILLHSVMAIAFGPKPPSYSSILDLDLKIRNFPVPAQWRPICEQETPTPPPEIQMIRFMVSFAKESTLLHLHRSYFMSALEECPNDLSKHSFIPSVLAIYRSAWRLMRGLRFIWGFVPELISKMNAVWSQVLSAAVVMCLFVARTPGSHLTDPALNELDLLVELFEEAVPTCQAASDLLNDLQSLRRHARAIVGRTHENEGYPISPSDLDRLSGKTYLLMLSEARSTSGTSQQRQQTPQQQHIGSSSSQLGSTIKRDPSPSHATSAALTDLSANSPFTMSTSLPMSSMHTPAAPPPLSLPTHSYSPYPYSHSYLSPPSSRPQTSRTSGSGPAHASSSSSSSSSHPIQPSVPSAPAPPITQSSISASTTHALHPTLVQDIHDFTMRGAPAGSPAIPYFGYAPDEDIEVASPIPTTQRLGSSTGGANNPSHSHSVGPAPASAPVPAPASSSTSRSRDLAGPVFQQQIYQSQAQPTTSSGHAQEYDYGFFQSLESSFQIDYAPQPRSPFTAANFGAGMSGSGGAPMLHSSYQDLVEHLGFH